MAKNKTFETEASVIAFVNEVADEQKRADAFRVIQIMESTTGLPAKMWGTAIVGFGTYHYVYESGREGDSPLVAFSPRKNAIVFYLGCGEKDRESLLKKFGKHTSGKGCVYIKKLADVDEAVLIKLIFKSVEHYRAKYSTL